MSLPILLGLLAAQSVAFALVIVGSALVPAGATASRRRVSASRPTSA